MKSLKTILIILLIITFIVGLYIWINICHQQLVNNYYLDILEYYTEYKPIYNNNGYIVSITLK